MKEILAILFMFLVGLVPELIASKKKKTESQKSQTPPLYKSDERWKNESAMLGNEENLSKEPEYFTLETLEPEVENGEKYVDRLPKENQQIFENQEENNRTLTFEKEELVKGIIYSEILKRKYN